MPEQAVLRRSDHEQVCVVVLGDLVQASADRRRARPHQPGIVPRLSPHRFQQLAAARALGGGKLRAHRAHPRIPAVHIGERQPSVFVQQRPGERKGIAATKVLVDTYDNVAEHFIASWDWSGHAGRRRSRRPPDTRSTRGARPSARVVLAAAVSEDLDDPAAPRRADRPGSPRASIQSPGVAERALSLVIMLPSVLFLQCTSHPSPPRTGTASLPTTERGPGDLRSPVSQAPIPESGARCARPAAARPDGISSDRPRDAGSRSRSSRRRSITSRWRCPESPALTPISPNPLNTVAVIKTAAQRVLASLQCGRSHDGQLVVITQSSADVEALTGQAGLLASLTDDFAAIVAHRQTSPESRDWLAKLVSTRALWQNPTETEVNLLMLGFNLVPALPLDGGRVARGLLWRRTGDIRPARVAAPSNVSMTPGI
jgi:hypothetical protein